MNTVLRFVYYRIIVKVVVSFALGLNVRNHDKLPDKGPAIIVANHNSHLDTMVLVTLFPGYLLPKIKPVAAMDYFLRNPLLAWFALNVIGILPIKRRIENRTDNPLQPCSERLDKGDILIFFPEGSRGKPESVSKFKSGIAKLAQDNIKVPIVPVLLHGLGKALPKGEALLVPFFCDVFIGDAIHFKDNRKAFMNQLEQSMESLSAEGEFPPWD